MVSDKEPLFGQHHGHRKNWFRALQVEPRICPGKDPEDTTCKCPDLVYSTRIRLSTGDSFNNYIYCGCCDLPITLPEAGSTA